MKYFYYWSCSKVKNRQMKNGHSVMARSYISGPLLFRCLFLFWVVAFLYTKVSTGLSTRNLFPMCGGTILYLPWLLFLTCFLLLLRTKYLTKIEVIKPFGIHL